MNKYRVIKHGWYYYPQRKSWFFWGFIVDENAVYSRYVHYSSAAEAVDFIQNLKEKTREEDKVVWSD